jgi:hypothetical protein
MEVRSYRRVFDLERRIYRVDRLRLNPGGVPVRGIVYVLAALAAMLIATRLPLAGLAMRRLPWFARYLAIPGLTGALLAVVRVEGRPFHLAALALLRHRLQRRIAPGMRVAPGMRTARTQLAGGVRWSPPPLLMLADGCDLPRRVRYTGPGAVLISVAHDRQSAGGPLVRLGVRPHVSVRAKLDGARPASGTVVLLDRAARLSVR